MKSLTPLLLVMIVLVLFPGDGVVAGSGGKKVVADRLYYGGPEGNAAYAIFGKFHTRSQMTAYLRLDARVGKFSGRSWALSEILVSMDLNANGYVAQWVVSGPKPLIETYLTSLRKIHESGNMMYDFSVVPMDVAPTAGFETETGAREKGDVIETPDNKYRIECHYCTAVRIIPHGLIDQAKDSVVALHGAEHLISFARSFHIGEYTFGYLVHKEKGKIHLYLVSCSHANQNFVIVSGICKRGNWKTEIIRLLELSIKALEKYDRNSADEGKKRRED
jgi:hypothetical protein